MQALLLHPDDDFHGSWTRQHWHSVIDLGRAPKSFYDERSAALGCPVFSIFDLAVEVEDLQVWRHLLQTRHGTGCGPVRHRLVGRDQCVAAAGIAGCPARASLAEKLKGFSTLAASRPSLTAEALRVQLGIPLQVLHRGLRKRLVHGVLRRGSAMANLSFEQLRQVVYDKYDPHYRWRRKLAPARLSKVGSEPVVLLPSAYSNVTKTAFSYAAILPEQKFLLVLARESGAVSPAPVNVQPVHLAGFAAKDCDREELKNLEGRWQQMEQSLREHPAFRLPV